MLIELNQLLSADFIDLHQIDRQNGEWGWILQRRGQAGRYCESFEHPQSIVSVDEGMIGVRWLRGSSLLR
jgi:hypothetical protein